MGDSPGRRTDVRIRLLGPLQVLVGGRNVAAGGRRQRGLLALLALSAGVAVPPSKLVDLLWDDDPPPAAMNTVQVYVSRLRRLFAADGLRSPLLSVSGAYLLDLPPDSVDAVCFERLAELGRERLAADDPAGAARELRQALDLWRGSAVPDLAGTSVAEAAVARLESMRVAVLADRIDADALLGRHPVLIAELEELVLQYPLDERFVGQLMTALYRAGRQAEAFAAYSAASERLADELGVDPGPALRALHTKILRQDADLDVRTIVRPSTPAPRVGDQVLPARSATPAPARSVPAGAALSGLPLPRQVGVPAPRPVPEIVPPRAPGQPVAGSLIGRRAELSAVLELVRRPEARLITLLGPAGSGKTRLAAEVVAVLRGGAPDPSGRRHTPLRVVPVTLAGVTEGAQVMAEVCRALGVEPGANGRPAIDLAAAALGDGPVVLVLDDVEHLVGGGLAGLGELPARSARLTVLTASRAVLGLTGEHLVPVGPLALPPPDGSRDPRSVAATEAVQLFRERARAVLPSFEVTAANAGAVADLVRGLDGLPLALELAAVRVRVLPPEDIVRRLDRRLDLLTDGGDHRPDRRRSLVSSLDAGARLLDPVERRLLGQLSIFAGGWTLDAAEQICGPDLGGAPVVDVLGRLADKSLVIADGSGRLGMLGIFRDYAHRLLDTDPAVAGTTRDRHAEHYAALAEQLEPQMRDWIVVPHQQLGVEAGNFGLALEHAAGDDATGVRDGELLGRLVAGLLDQWFAAGRWREAEHWLRAALRAPSLSPLLRARLLLSFGRLAIVGGDLPAAAEALAEAHEISLALDDPLLSVCTGAVRAVTARYLGQTGAAITFLTAALEALTGTRNPIGPPVAAGSWARPSLRAVGAVADGTPMEPALEEELGEVLVTLARSLQAVRLGHDHGQLLPLPEVLALLGGALKRDEPVMAARLKAAAQAWRTARSLAGSGLSGQAVVTEAEAVLTEAVRAGERAAELIEAQREWGEGVVIDLRALVRPK